ncbi:hypothetical protein Tco_1175204 [Tanacetum coccineum]
MPRDYLRIIESKSKVRNSRNKPVVAKVSSSTSTPDISPDVAELKDMVKALLLDKKTQASAPVKAVEKSCVTCGGAHFYRNCPAIDGNIYRDNIQEYVSQAATANYNQGNTGYRVPIANQIRPLDRRREKANDQIEKFYKIFKDLSFKTSLTDALILMLKFTSTFKALIGNKEILSEMARTPLTEHCSAVLSTIFLALDNIAALSVEKLSLPELTPTCVTLELVDRSISQTIGIAEDVYLK